MNPNSVAAPTPGLMHDIMPPYAKAFNKTMTASPPTGGDTLPQQPAAPSVPVTEPAPAPNPVPGPPVPAEPAPTQEPTTSMSAESIPVQQQSASSPAVQPMFPTETALVPMPSVQTEAPVQVADDQASQPAAAKVAHMPHKPRTNWLVISLAVIVALGLAVAAYFALKSSSQI